MANHGNRNPSGSSDERDQGSQRNPNQSDQGSQRSPGDRSKPGGMNQGDRSRREPDTETEEERDRIRSSYDQDL